MQRGDRRHGLGESPTSNAADLGKGESASPRRGLEGGTGGGRKEKEGSRGCGCAGPAPATGDLSDALSSVFQGPPSREDGNQFPGCSRETTGPRSRGPDPGPGRGSHLSAQFKGQGNANQGKLELNATFEKLKLAYSAGLPPLWRSSFVDQTLRLILVPGPPGSPLGHLPQAPPRRGLHPSRGPAGRCLPPCSERPGSPRTEPGLSATWHRSPSSAGARRGLRAFQRQDLTPARALGCFCSPWRGVGYPGWSCSDPAPTAE